MAKGELRKKLDAMRFEFHLKTMENLARSNRRGRLQY